MCADKANRLDVGNAVNPRPSDEDKKLVVVKSPNAINPLVWDYSVSVSCQCLYSKAKLHFKFSLLPNFFQEIKIWKKLVL